MPLMEYCVLEEHQNVDDFDPAGKTFHRLGINQEVKIMFHTDSIVLTSGQAWWSYSCWWETPFPGSCGIWSCNYPNSNVPDRIYVRFADMDELVGTKVLFATYGKKGTYWFVTLRYALTDEVFMEMRAPVKQTWKDFIFTKVFPRAQCDMIEMPCKRCKFRIMLGYLGKDDMLPSDDRREMGEIFADQINQMKQGKKRRSTESVADKSEDPAADKSKEPAADKSKEPAADKGPAAKVRRPAAKR